MENLKTLIVTAISACRCDAELTVLLLSHLRAADLPDEALAQIWQAHMLMQQQQQQQQQPPSQGLEELLAAGHAVWHENAVRVCTSTPTSGFHQEVSAMLQRWVHM